MKIKVALSSIIVMFLVACNPHEPLETVDYVDLQKFMGDWYVIANIPTIFEKGAHNPVESYSLNADGSIATTFTFNANSFEGEKKIFRPTAFVKNTQTNAQWGMQFVWPIKADYSIVYLDADYQYTVIARDQRDYVWIMARSPQIPEPMYNELTDHINAIGYDISLLQRSPHQQPIIK
jgi:apolipoprotein D and lipocalin family protein